MTFDYQRFPIGDRRVDKQWEDGEAEIVASGLKQWVVEEFGGKVAGWFVVHEADTEAAANEWLAQNPHGA